MKKRSTKDEPSVASDDSSELSAWGFDAKKLGTVGDFFQRMHGLGALQCRVGPVAVNFAPAPMALGEDSDKRPRKLTKEDVLFHSA